MGVRLKGEYYSTDGELWTWQLIDTGFGDLQHDCTLSSEGIVFKYDGESRTKDSRFMITTATLSIMVDHNNIDDFISDFRNAAEGRFFLRAGKDGGVTYIGRITADDGQYEDNARPFPIRLTAVDGIGGLAEKNYADGNTPYADQPTLLQHVFNCLDKTGLIDHYTGQDYLWVVCNWYEDQHANNTDNPLAVTRVDAKAFYEVAQQTATYDFMSCRDVLRNILINFQAQLIYVGPHYLIQQRSERASSSFRVFKYSTAHALTSSGNVSDEVTISNAGGINFRQGISSFGWLPPMHKAKITYNHGEQDVNLLQGLGYEGYNHFADPGPDGTMAEVGTVSVDPGQVVILRFAGKLRTNSKTYGGTPVPRWKNHRYHFRIKIKVETDVVTWWRRDYAAIDFYDGNTSTYGLAYWNGSGEEYFDWVSPIIDEQMADVNLFHHIGFDTLALQQDALSTISFGFEVVRVFDEKLQTVDTSANPVLCSWEFTDLELVALENGDILKRPTKTVSEVIGSDDHTFSLVEETVIGDGPGKSSKGRLQVYDGSEWRDSSLWKAAGFGTSRKLHLVAAQEALSSQQTSLLVLQGGFYATTAAATAMSRIYYVGLYFLPMSCQYNTATDLWTGEWCQIITPSRTGLTWIDKTIINKEKVPIPLNPGKLADDENKEDRVIKFPWLTGDEIEKDTAITSISLGTTAEVDMFYEGDVIYLVDPVHGHAEKVTVATDVKAGDTTVSIESFTPTYNYPPGSYLEPDPVTQNVYSESAQAYMLEENFSGTELVVDHPLTDVTLEPDQATIAKRHWVLKNGQKLRYGHAYGYTINNVGNKIVFAEACYGDDIEIFTNKIKKVYA